MVLVKEYRICLPMTVSEFKVGQIYMIARHSFEQSGENGGVEVVCVSKCKDSHYGVGKFTEKRIHLSKHIPTWLQNVLPKIFYVTEKSWNYYPYTVTEYTCSFLPRFSIKIETIYKDDDEMAENALHLSPNDLAERIVDNIDIANDELSPKNYYKDEDLSVFKSEKTGRGPLLRNWQKEQKPMMCCYKLVVANFEIWGLQTKIEKYIHTFLREILLIGHKKAFAWIDQWIEMTFEEAKQYEMLFQQKTNNLVKQEAEENESKDAEPKKKNFAGALMNKV